MSGELEPAVEAQIAMMDDEPGAYGPEAMAALYTKSAAISLKRIADFVDGDALNYNSIIDLFWQAGQAFERGKGTA